MRLLLSFVFVLRLCAADAEWKPLFNGKDLSGWVPVNVAPATFTVRDGLIVSTGKPTGVIRTDRHYENFELELEYKHIVPGGNAGLFIWSDPVTAPGQPFTRAIEVQILDGRRTDNYTSDGDIFSIHGARFKPDRPHPGGWERSLPSERRAKPAGEWNHYRVVCNNGDIKLAVNGKVVSGGTNATPRKGYICLEAEGSECHFRNIRLRELPSTNPSAEETAGVADGFVSVYTGLNLDGWKSTAEHAQHWKSTDWILDYDGKYTAQDPNLWTQKVYRDFILICDWRSQNKAAQNPRILLRGAAMPALPEKAKPPGEWNRYMITVKGDRLTIQLNGSAVVSDKPLSIPTSGHIGLPASAHPLQFANIYIREL